MLDVLTAGEVWIKLKYLVSGAEFSTLTVWNNRRTQLVVHDSKLFELMVGLSKLNGASSKLLRLEC